MPASAFGKKLQQLREKAGLSRDQLGKRVGVHYASIWRYEEGKSTPEPDLQARLLAALDGSPAKKRGRPKKYRPGEPARCKCVIQPVGEGAGDDEAPEPDSRGRDERNRTPVRLGSVSRAWIGQTVDSHVHARGAVICDGQARIVTMRRADLIELGQALLEACGTKVQEG